jgi:predicted Zn-dependent protease
MDVPRADSLQPKSSVHLDHAARDKVVLRDEDGCRRNLGRLAEPVAELNVAGNQNELWQHLVAVGNDPWPFAALRTPTLVFEGAQIAGL